MFSAAIQREQGLMCFECESPGCGDVVGRVILDKINCETSCYIQRDGDSKCSKRAANLNH